MRFNWAAFLIFNVVVAGAAVAAQTNAPEPSNKTGANVLVVAEGLRSPWGMQFLPDGRVIVTERPGNIRIISRDGTISEPISGAPKAWARGQGGMLDIALAPDFETSRQVFISFAQERGAKGGATSVVRATLVDEPDRERLTDTRVIFEQEPASGGGRHFGSRLAFGGDGNLFVTLGDRGQRSLAQDLDGHIGKIVRIRPDGKVPSENPFVGRPGVQEEIWSFGHRNPQAAAIHPQTGALWTIEHGARGGDEINIPQAGRNYGWPVITYGRDYSGAKIGIGTRKDGMEQPIYYWDPSIAPSGMAFYADERFPEWSGNLFVGALRDRHLSRLILDDDRVVAEEKLLESLGERIRDVRQGPDGFLYVLTDSSNGQLLRLAPAQ
ncbi:MAG: PQQ-dependent sugar dehydrogenase [Hyphomicrobiaceae bacterium]